MPTAKEFTVPLEDRPGTLGKLSRALADRQVNILAFQSFPFEGKGWTRIVVDNPRPPRQSLMVSASRSQNPKLPRSNFHTGRASLHGPPRDSAMRTSTSTMPTAGSSQGPTRPWYSLASRRSARQ